MFPADSVDLEHFAPVPLAAMIEEVLLPEVQLLIISEDHKVSSEEAVVILQDSSAFGGVLHSESTTQARRLAPLPPLSPLSHPQEVERPFTASDLEFPPDEAAVDPSTLCHWCDEPLPQVQSESLIRIRNGLLACTVPDPLPLTPLHRRATSTQVFISYCVQHRFERDDLPKVPHNWPRNPDYGSLFRRILATGPELRGICKTIKESSHFLASVKYYEAHPMRLLGVDSQFRDMDRLANHIVG